VWFVLALGRSQKDSGSMSGAYSLFHVFNELLDEKTNANSTARGKTMGAKSEIYQGAWSALNAWLETKLAKQKVSRLDLETLSMDSALTRCPPSLSLY
jgi:hypothetical protein